MKAFDGDAEELVFDKDCRRTKQWADSDMKKGVSFSCVFSHTVSTYLYNIVCAHYLGYKQVQVLGLLVSVCLSTNLACCLWNVCFQAILCVQHWQLSILLSRCNLVLCSLAGLPRCSGDRSLAFTVHCLLALVFSSAFLEMKNKDVWS